MISENQILTELALGKLGCKEIDLITKLHITKAELKTWKTQDSTFDTIGKKLRVLSGIGNENVYLVYLAGTLEDTSKWKRLFQYLATITVERNETPYEPILLIDDDPWLGLSESTAETLMGLGVNLPQPFPPELDFDYLKLDVFDDEGVQAEAFMSNPYVEFLAEMYRSYMNVYGYFCAYVSKLLDEIADSDLSHDFVQSCLLDLAAAKIKTTPFFLPNFECFR